MKDSSRSPIKDIIQARAQSAWLRGLLAESTGKQFDVFPVVVFPGWYIDRIKDERFGASGLFGREKDDSLEGSLAAVMQSFGDQELYPSLEEKAATCSTFW